MRNRDYLAGRFAAQAARKDMRGGDHQYATQSEARFQLASEVVDTEAPRLSAPVIAFLTALRFAEMPLPVTEHRFHPTRKWQFDYAWPDRKLALEVEGGIWRKGGGAHSHPTNIVRDCEKYSEAAILGWRILRVPPESLRTVGVDYVTRALA